jgi:hypothetical protein
VRVSGDDGHEIHVVCENGCGRGRRDESGEVSEIVNVLPASQSISKVARSKFLWPIPSSPSRVYEVSMGGKSISKEAQVFNLPVCIACPSRYAAMWPTKRTCSWSLRTGCRLVGRVNRNQRSDAKYAAIVLKFDFIMEMDKFWLAVYYDQFPESLRLDL